MQNIPLKEQQNTKILWIIIGVLFVIALIVTGFKYSKDTKKEKKDNTINQKTEVKTEPIEIQTIKTETKENVKTDDINSIEEDLKNTDVTF